MISRRELENTEKRGRKRKRKPEKVVKLLRFFGIGQQNHMLLPMLVHNTYRQSIQSDCGSRRLSQPLRKIKRQNGEWQKQTQSQSSCVSLTLSSLSLSLLLSLSLSHTHTHTHTKSARAHTLSACVCMRNTYLLGQHRHSVFVSNNSQPVY